MIGYMNVKIFADGADIETMIQMNAQSYISGLTTNPTLMRKAGISDYRKFAKEILSHIDVKPISFEVFSDDFEEMKRQALEIASWGENVYVKIPVTNSKGESASSVISFLTKEGVKVNVTAIMTLEQVNDVVNVFDSRVEGYISVFAGRIADTGRDPIPIMKEALTIMSNNPKLELIWASPRELLNVVQADQINCHIITATSDILNKLSLINKDLKAYSLETVRMFRDDAVSSGFTL